MLLRTVIAAAVLSLMGAWALQTPAPASKATVELYTSSKCASCHGPDGHASGAAGKALGARDFHSPEVQNETDAALADVISKGKNKMPAYGKQLTAAQIQALVGYVRQLGK